MNNVFDYAKEKKLSFIAIKNDKIIFKSDDFGIQPAFYFYNKYKDIDNVLVYDKIIGQGAARLFRKTKVQRIKTLIISTKAIELLERHLDLQYDMEVQHILNRERTDYCPIEKLSMNNPSFDLFYDALQRFIG